MPIIDRVAIWKTQMAFHLATGKFSREQNSFIAEMLMSISPATFEPRNLTKEEEEIAFNELMAKILTHFSRAESFAIFEEIGIQKTVPDVKNYLAPSWCDCRWYCSGDNSCRTISCVIFPDCGPTGNWECHYVCTL